MTISKWKDSLSWLGLLAAFMFLTMTCPESARSSSVDPALDVVVDLDGTLLDTLPGAAPQAFFVEGKWYRFREFASEFIDKLRQLPAARISFYSGGNDSRNEVVLRHLILADGKSAKAIAYRDLGYDDMANISSDENQRFIYRYKKDLRKVNPDLRRVVIVDDIQNFVLAGQEAHVVWLGAGADSKTLLQKSFSMIQKAEKDSRGNPFSFGQLIIQAQQLPLCPQIFF